MRRATSARSVTTAPATPHVTASDRLGLTIFLALAFHALIILGVGFEFEDEQPSETTRTLDVTLVSRKTEEAPQDPDYLAQENQRGGGNTQERVRPTQPEAQPSENERPAPSQVTRAPASPNEPQPARAQVVTRGDSEPKAVDRPEAPQTAERPEPDAAQLMRLGKEIAHLEARIDATQRAYSSKPKAKFLYANTRKFDEALYLNAWTQKVERIGNLNYPDQARRQALSGRLLMEVILHPDGSVRDIRVLESSNEPVLDEAARQIVRLAAPFAEVPAEVLEGKSELHIVRTWVFTNRNELVSR